ncbi:tRNA dimethylallyltransferase [Capnocytophaga haemolytica]|uniref:tRNA dimethylallyltransferase n=1 Tax=Capnocytophaga haemolytica TaxID=45243 RepID=A0AAX2GW34_9FLAO|nr:tRNA (adenosine(37)-N6)-dimethylallyltransferase MiaA [Capnocytophaga haemolytica]AMD85297.1 tRNA dimethylallyltransferase [Capnocytophaga haemolytica]SFN61755.1 tRNA dimethylallyltransferase [Capnocytophaga haemolytica]SNV03534.1 tRNA dimethylallyltransferase [Capnocytophaga haemolytica]
MRPLKKTLINISGPTAIGKTRMAIALAKHFNTEILSCDSRQFFKEMYIGTAVPEADELAEIKHHFIQHKSIFTPYSVGDFEREATALLSELFKQHDVVVMVGGSGLYADALIHGLDSFPAVPEEVRNELKATYQAQGITYLQELLSRLDPEHYTRVDKNNPQRMIRALEVCLASGLPYSSFLKQHNTQRDFTTVEIALTAEREVVYQRINSRVEQMLERGLIIEAQDLYPHRDLNALQTVGYRELFSFLSGVYTLDVAIEEIKKNTRRFAKRQYTWLAKNKNIHWFDYQTSAEQIAEKITSFTR